MFGFYNRLLEIDMNKKSFAINHIPDEILRGTLGGKGLATHLLIQHNPPQVDPLSPDNHLIIATGPVTDTPIWGSCRHGVFTKSPQTGYYSESYSGGTAAEYMARTGYDAVMIKGASMDPVWIEVSEEGAYFHSAQDLWGTESYVTEDRVKALIKENRPDAKNCGVVCIGPAGENRVAFAVIENDYWRSAGRTGVGAVMGSKGIKAIAFRGKKKKGLANPELVKTFAKEFAKKAKDDKGVLNYKTMGTPMMVDVMSGVGSFPTRYWHKGRAEHQQSINAPALHERLNVLPHACRRCFIACGRLATVKQGRHKGLRIEGPEYETIYALGGLCEVDSIEEIAYLNDICDRLGLDTISAGNLVAFTIEASRQGKIDYDIDYGQVDKIAGLLEDIVYRRGIGDTLAKGIKTVAKAWDMEDQAIHVKGMEPAGYDPRILKGMGLAYGTSDRGACHLRATFYKPELANMIDPDQIEGKAEMFAEWEDRLTIFDSLILCRFYRDLYQWEELAIVIKGITGLEMDRERMRSIAGAITNNTRRFNIREGLSPEEDHLPKRFYTEALPETGKVITRGQMEQLLADYYSVRGWDEKGRLRDND
ncbi:MAG TPA: aldehyde ferredoxin oxidoreductase family protein [Desulfatiglandales bacterium]|nr:aldehyde ferredoxin oxidoreductase family protein [Desulfatiglandales bacterium]